MNGRDGKPFRGGDAGQGRDARLAEALRENLRRRKAQARSRTRPERDTAGENETAPSDVSGANSGDDPDD